MRNKQDGQIECNSNAAKKNTTAKLHDSQVFHEKKKKLAKTRCRIPSIHVEELWQKIKKNLLR